MYAPTLEEITALRDKILSLPDEDYTHLTDAQAILSFQGSWLSNLYACPVILNGITYPSVEHGYQRAKFMHLDWTTLPEVTKDALKEHLRSKGYAAPIAFDASMFTLDSLPSGMSKSIANILRDGGLIDKDWHERSVATMIELLLQKYHYDEFETKLLSTGNKVLVEGNTWNDTFWGICEGKGRNLLGKALMEIRTMLKN